MQTIRFENPPHIVDTGTIVGPMEGRGPLHNDFDVCIEDYTFGEKTPEKAECRFLEESVKIVLEKAKVTPDQVDYFLAGDLLNQIVCSNFAARQLQMPFLGLYGACSTSMEGLTLGSVLIDGGFADRVVVGASSHYQTAERQYRYPIELNIKRKTTAQYTVTGGGAALLSNSGGSPRVTFATIGKVLDLGMKDPNDMGSAMAPAASETIFQHFIDTGIRPEDYDLIVTGDLAKVGKTMLTELLKEKGVAIGPNYDDAGTMIFGPRQSVGAGGSGCACSAVVVFGHVIRQMRAGLYKKVLCVATGALHSPVTCQQGESIPGIAHAVVLER